MVLKLVIYTIKQKKKTAQKLVSHTIKKHGPEILYPYYKSKENMA